MSIVKCPNCGKNTYDDYKCNWCKYTLKEKEHAFDSEKYNLLKAEYVNNPKKTEIIKLGMEKYGLELSECKEIVNHIAEAIYEGNNYKTFDEVNHKNENAIYKFSFIQYFIHDFIYKVIIAILIMYGVKKCPTLKMSIPLLLVFGSWCILSLYQLVKAATSTFIFDTGKIEYTYQSSNHTASAGGKRYEAKSASTQFEERFGKHNIYEINSITEVKETINSIYVEGSIKYVVARFWLSGKYQRKEKKQMKKIRIPKYFKKNREIASKLRQRVK